MKTLIFSDTHLTNVFSLSQFDYLERIITHADRVIINGDFWDRSFVTFDQFINSRWRSLFPLLKDRETIYIFGNHDQQAWCDQRVSEFSVRQCKETRLDVGSKRLVIMHGDIITLSPELHIPWHPARSLNALLGSRVEAMGIKVLGRHFQKVGSLLNKSMKIFAQRYLGENEILVCGHSHLPEWNLDENFINSGINRHGYGQYVLVDGNNIRLTLEYWGVGTQASLSPYVVRTGDELANTRQDFSTFFPTGHCR